LKAAEPGLRTRHLLRLARQDTATSRTLASRSLPGTMPAPTDPSRPGQRESRYYQPPVSTSPPTAGTRIVITGPSGRALVIQSPRAAGRPTVTLRPPGMMPPPTPADSLAAETRSPLEGRIWRTPSRARLAAMVREER